MGKLIGALAGLAAIGALVYYAIAGSGAAPPEVAFAKVARQTIISQIVTNGRIEPAEYSTVRAPRDGPLARLAVEKGQRIAAGQEIAQLESADLAADIAAAESRITQAKTDLALLEQGGSAAAQAELDGSIAAVKLDLATARREAERTARLVEKNAETAEALTLARDRVKQLETQAASLETRRASLVPSGGSRDAARARLREGEAALAVLRRRQEQSLVRSPIAGVVYNVAVRRDAFLRAGDAIAEIARMGSVKAVVYVDEPELGRVATGMRVKITWDAMPGRAWDAAVDKLPTQIVPLNSRQVGEVICLLEGSSSSGELPPPGANVNAEIRSREAAGVLAIPKAALRREGAVTGVLILRDGRQLEWKPVQVGVSSLTHAEVTGGGLAEGDEVALPGDAPLSAGQVVTPAGARSAIATPK